MRCSTFDLWPISSEFTACKVSFFYPTCGGGTCRHSLEQGSTKTVVSVIQSQSPNFDEKGQHTAKSPAGWI